MLLICRNRRFAGAGAAGSFANLEAGKALDDDVFAEVGNSLLDHLADGHALILDIVLFVEAILLVELFHFARDDAVHDGLGLARGKRLRAVDLALFLEHFRRNFLTADVARVKRGNVHGDIVREIVKTLGARDEIGLAIDLHEHADLPARVDITADESFGSFAHGFLGGSGLPLLAQNANGLLEIAAGFHERGSAIGKARIRALAQLLDELRGNLNCWLLCAHPVSLLAEIGLPTFRRPEAPCKTARRVIRVAAPGRRISSPTQNSSSAAPRRAAPWLRRPKAA